MLKTHPKSIIRTFKGNDRWVQENLQEESRGYVILQVEAVSEGATLLVEYVDKVYYTYTVDNSVNNN